MTVAMRTGERNFRGYNTIRNRLITLTLRFKLIA